MATTLTRDELIKVAERAVELYGTAQYPDVVETFLAKAREVPSVLRFGWWADDEKTPTGCLVGWIAKDVADREGLSFDVALDRTLGWSEEDEQEPRGRLLMNLGHGFAQALDELHGHGDPVTWTPEVPLNVIEITD